MAEEHWRAASPFQGMNATAEVWARVRVVHAQWQVEEPGLKIAETANRLLSFGLEHAYAARKAALAKKESDASLP